MQQRKFKNMRLGIATRVCIAGCAIARREGVRMKKIVIVCLLSLIVGVVGMYNVMVHVQQVSSVNGTYVVSAFGIDNVYR